MNITIEGIARLDQGIPFGDYRIGCAQITKIKLNPGETLESYKDSGLVFDVAVKRLVPEEKVDPNVVYPTVAAFDFSKGLTTARNYVLYVVDGGDTTIIGTIGDLVEIFGLPEEEGKQLEANLPTLASQRQMCITTYHDPNRDEDCFMFVPDFDAEITEDLLKDTEESAKMVAGKIADLMNNPNSADYRAQLTSHSFIKMLLYTLVETGQKRYNYYSCECVIKDVATKLSNITYYSEGKLNTPTIKDMEGYLDMIKRSVKITPEM